MRKTAFHLCIPILLCQSAYTQNKPPEIYLNHLFVVLDSATYRQLFDLPLLSEKLGMIDTSSVTTTEESWSGKYLYGKNSYFEFFSTRGYEGAIVGDLGLGFMTFKSNDIWEIEKHWKENGRDSVLTDTTTYVVEGKSQKWYYSIDLHTIDSSESFSAWIMENTPEELKFAGFSEEEISKPITWEDYVERLNHATFTKSFDRISSVELTISEEEYDYLKRSLTGFGLQEKRNTFFNNYITIGCTIQAHPASRLKEVQIELSESYPKRKLQISDQLTVIVHGKKAVLKFND